MIVFPMQTLPMIEQLQIELIANCEIKKSMLAGKHWVLTAIARSCLIVLLDLDCVPGHYSIDSLAHCIKDYDFDFCESVDLI